jgi:integrase
MAYIERRKYKTKTSYLVMVRRKGFKTMVKTFDTRTDAKKWARAVERKLDTGDSADYSEASKLLLGDILKRYISENKHRKLRSYKMFEYRIKILLNDTVSDINLLRLSSKHVAEFRDRKLLEVGNSTFNKYLSLISVVIETARQDWGIYLPVNPCRLVRREKEPNPRDKVLDDNEYSRLLKACSKSTNRYLKPLVLFAMETAMRKGELLQLRYRNINFDRRTLLIPFTKTGKPRTIPLSTKAIEILRSMPRRLDGKVFPLTVDSLRNSFKIAKQKAAIEGFRFHDIRRMSCSSLFEKGFSLPEVQMFSGHRTSSILLSTYTKLSAEKIANKLKARGH